MHTIAVPWWFGLAFLFSVCGLALWAGRRTERAGAAILLLGWAASVLLRTHHWSELQSGVLIVDGAMFVALLILALRSDRFWPLAAAGFQLLGVITHGARLLDRHVGAWAYITAGVIWSYLVILALAVGTYNRWRERRQLAANAAAEGVAAPGATRL